ncbi:MAG: AbrB/MazE/SpoVT family DNA-binding domain-containing protein [Methanobrevibacter sp.]|jgi:bifunctional DNA-binding transcriptional regulator/antitoxin component of YhaV-PrlF toxin-antitoxin module|nr:AbrB/MazE/SpoVT family DNA-binding domain-containing protein [Candidatus Methanoflexus mossambicus]
MSFSTKIYKGFQTVIPSEIRKKLNLEVDDIVEWFFDETGSINIEFRKRSNFEDIIGIGESEEKTDAVKLKKRIAQGFKP